MLHEPWKPAALLAISLLATVHAGALEDCSAAIALIDEKIVAARAAGQDVSIAEGMKLSLEQSCAYLDQESLDNMVQSLDSILPMMSALYEQAEAMNAGSATRPSAPASENPRPADGFAGLRKLGTAVGGKLMERPDRMNQFAIWDADLGNGEARIAYGTRPTIEQFGLPDWEQVAETLARHFAITLGQELPADGSLTPVERQRADALAARQLIDTAGRSDGDR